MSWRDTSRGASLRDHCGGLIFYVNLLYFTFKQHICMCIFKAISYHDEYAFSGTNQHYLPAVMDWTVHISSENELQLEYRIGRAGQGAP